MYRFSSRGDTLISTLATSATLLIVGRPLISLVERHDHLASLPSVILAGVRGGECISDVLFSALEMRECRFVSSKRFGNNVEELAASSLCFETAGTSF
jgi:hypothetical protein